MDRTLIRPSRSKLNKKAEALLGRLQLWSRGSLAKQRETYWVLNSLHLRLEGHLQRLKQLNIPPSGVLTLTSQGTTAPYNSNLQLQIRLFFGFFPHVQLLQISHTISAKATSFRLRKQHPRQAHSEAAAWWGNFVLCRLSLLKKYLFIDRFIENRGK